LERIFSNSSDIITKKRTSLSPDTVQYSLCLQNWGVLADVDDVDDADDERDGEAEE
jgi:hypothetical protein